MPDINHMTTSDVMYAASINLLCDLDSADNLPSISALERFFLSSDRTVLSLVVLSIGLIDNDGSMILDPNTAPWKTMSDNMTKFKAVVLKAECIRLMLPFPAESNIAPLSLDPQVRPTSIIHSN